MTRRGYSRSWGRCFRPSPARLLPSERRRRRLLRSHRLKSQLRSRCHSARMPPPLRVRSCMRSPVSQGPEIERAAVFRHRRWIRATRRKLSSPKRNPPPSLLRSLSLLQSLRPSPPPSQLPSPRCSIRLMKRMINPCRRKSQPSQHPNRSSSQLPTRLTRTTDPCHRKKQPSRLHPSRLPSQHRTRLMMKMTDPGRKERPSRSSPATAWLLVGVPVPYYGVILLRIAILGIAIAKVGHPIPMARSQASRSKL